MIISNYIRTHGFYSAHIPAMNYHHYKKNFANNERKLLLLHGIRLGGLLTWEPVIRNFNEWSDILLPDLPGAGSLNPMNKTIYDFDLEVLLEAIINLIEQLDWQQFDLAGYSFGGFLSMMLAQRLKNRVSRHFILESALLIDLPENLPTSTAGLNPIAELMQTNPARGNQSFSETVYGKNVRPVSLAFKPIPNPNPLGFGNLLKILISIYNYDDIWSIINAQNNVTMLVTEPAFEPRKNIIDVVLKKYPWKIVTMHNVDHSVIFTNPNEVAVHLKEWYLS